MISIEIVRKCYICGNETLQRCCICEHCQSEVIRLEQPVCQICGIPLVSEKKLCLRCRDKSFSFTCNRSLFEYRGTAKDIFYQYKFESQRDIAIWYAQLMASIITCDYPGYLIVPSPPNVRKKVKKGWDQVEQLSLNLKKQHGKEVVRVLHKKKGREQKELDYNGRAENMKGRIAPKKNIGSIEGRRILLVDDIFTTGATAHECASVLMKNDALEVVSLTIAID